MRSALTLSAIATASLMVLAACSPGEKTAAAPEAVEAPAAAVEPAAPAAEAAAPAAGPVIQVGGLTGDATKGAVVFNQCKSCHAIEAGVNRVGPTLHGVVGRKAGAVEGFRYSAASKASAAVWSEETLFAYLENPRKFMPGTTMSYVGMRQPQQRADVIAYLKSQS
ncbi:MAG: cytochrome c family protein [Caulobacter sp.]|nr:cytochrome c family protein [Caulobacter sp.]